MRTVLCAVDLNDTSSRVVRQAAGLAAVLGLRLRIMHVATNRTREVPPRLDSLVECAMACRLSRAEIDVVVRTGDVSAAILAEAASPIVALLVMGTRALGRLGRLVSRSTSAAVLRKTPSPVLLVPPGDRDLIAIVDRHPKLTCGTVLAPVDPAAANTWQLHTAEGLSRLAGQSLLLMAVTKGAADDRRALRRMRTIATAASVCQAACIVRHGDVATEIATCAVEEHAGLVVLGLNDAGPGRSAATAARMLQRGGSFVLAVPEPQSISMMPHGLRSAAAPAIANVGSACGNRASA